VMAPPLRIRIVEKRETRRFFCPVSEAIVEDG
jgi:hypothetical protein